MAAPYPYAQLTTDRHRSYLADVEDAFGEDIDYAMLIKVYGARTTTRRSVTVRCVHRMAGNEIPGVAELRSP